MPIPLRKCWETSRLRDLRAFSAYLEYAVKLSGFLELESELSLGEEVRKY